MEKATSIPRIGSKLRKNILRMPEAVFQASGIVINGRRIKSCVLRRIWQLYATATQTPCSPFIRLRRSR